VALAPSLAGLCRVAEPASFPSFICMSLDPSVTLERKSDPSRFIKEVAASAPCVMDRCAGSLMRPLHSMLINDASLQCNWTIGVFDISEEPDALPCIGQGSLLSPLTVFRQRLSPFDGIMERASLPRYLPPLQSFVPLRELRGFH